MKKTGMIAAIGLSCAALCAVSADAQTMRKNEFYFSTPNLSQPFHFVLKDYKVTAGQPYGGVSSSIDTNKHYAYIYVNAGRKKSDLVAYWFLRRIEPGAALGSGATNAKMPAELNFGIMGDLTISAGETTLVCRDVVFGQGSQVILGNNWWVGGRHMTLVDKPNERRLLVQQCEGGTAKIAVGGVGNNNFDLYVYPPDKAKPRP